MNQLLIIVYWHLPGLNDVLEAKLLSCTRYIVLRVQTCLGFKESCTQTIRLVDVAKSDKVRIPYKYAQYAQVNYSH